MPEYIDKDKLYNNLTLLAKYQTGDRQQGILGCADTVRLTKPADVVDVVRCWECKHRIYKDIYGEEIGGCEIFNCALPGDFHCGFWERRDDDAAD